MNIAVRPLNVAICSPSVAQSETSSARANLYALGYTGATPWPHAKLLLTEASKRLSPNPSPSAMRWRPISGFSKAKTQLNKPIAEFRETKRTTERLARSHLSSLPIQERVGELVIAHSEPGLHKVYDQRAYRDEKREALEKWANKLHIIVRC